jgi:hypothetical protein
VAVRGERLRLTWGELDGDYFAAAVERVKRETAQMTLGL